MKRGESAMTRIAIYLLLCAVVGCGTIDSGSVYVDTPDCPFGFERNESSGDCRNDDGCMPERPYPWADGQCHPSRDPDPMNCPADFAWSESMGDCRNDAGCPITHPYWWDEDDGTCRTEPDQTSSPHDEGCSHRNPHLWRDGQCRSDPDPQRVCVLSEQPCEMCFSDKGCDDGMFCNGVEDCRFTKCFAGDPPCDEDQECDETLDECYEPCYADIDCADGLFCNGWERCNNGQCVPGEPPWCDWGCDETLNMCSQPEPQPDPVDDPDLFSCFPGQIAVNNSFICCSAGYPWYGTDGYCHMASLRADDDTFLGDIDSNPFNADSIANSFGTYGNRFSATSIWNEFGTYGSSFSALSPWNSFARTPPSVFLEDGTFAGYLTVNIFIGVMHPNDLAISVGREDAVR